jgi:predicted anti-sigma-YlaC factor YlaD
MQKIKHIWFITLPVILLRFIPPISSFSVPMSTESPTIMVNTHSYYPTIYYWPGVILYLVWILLSVFTLVSVVTNYLQKDVSSAKRLSLIILSICLLVLSILESIHFILELISINTPRPL